MSEPLEYEILKGKLVNIDIDLDTIKDGGLYFFESGHTYTNANSLTTFWLEVKAEHNTSKVYQEIKQLDGSAGYKRYFNSTWGSWASTASTSTEYLGTCSTASATAAKTVAITGFALSTGVRVKVTFTNANTTDVPTLNIESTGAKAIYNEGGVAVSATCPAYFPAGTTVDFYYDGTNWVYVNKIIDSYVSGYSWYKIFSNGWIEQGGNLGTYSSYSTVTITLLKSLKNTNYSIFCTNAITTGSSFSPIIHAKTTSTFTMRDILTTSGLGNWETKGF